MIRNDYRVRGRRSLDTLEDSIAHLAEIFGGVRVVAITSDRIAAYERSRLASGAARATVNKELAALRRMFNLAIRARRLPVSARPAISTPDPKNARTGFFEPGDFERVCEELPEALRAVMRFAYLTGWRVRSEVLPLTWDRVDFATGVVRLEPGTTKNDEGRVFPFGALPSLADLLRAQREHTRTVERAKGAIVPWVFHRDGKPIKSYQSGWRAACRRAVVEKRGGFEVVVRPHLSGRVAHDFRRAAVRNLVRAGVPERVAMALTGHKTREVFDRYDIVNEADLRAGVERLAAYVPAAVRGTEGGQTAARASGSEP